jgi:hypothetical protein
MLIKVSRTGRKVCGRKISLSWKRNTESDIKQYTIYEKILLFLKKVARVTANNTAISGISPEKRKHML